MTLDPDVDGLKFEIQEEARLGTRFKVIGVGGGGSNAVTRMMNEGLEGVEFYVMNTDLQALESSPAPNKLQFGAKITNGLGSGSDPEIGRQAALDDTERIVEILEGADMVFVTAGLGCGTGTGATPVVASLAKELGALTVAVITMPFSFEGPQRMRVATRGLSELASTVDTVIPIYNDRLLALLPKGTSFWDGFRIADEVVLQAVQGISDIITKPGLINRDFADIKATMLGMGFAMMGTAVARGEINYPLMEEGGIAGAKTVLVNITGSSKLGLHEVSEACSLVRQAAQCEDVQIGFGVVLNESLGEAVKITVIATGFQRDTVSETERPAAGQEPWTGQAGPRPVPEPVLHGPAPVQETAPADDLETPAYLRREKLLF
jgi:cell division protein FtsZ